MSEKKVNKIKTAVLTISDKGSRGERDDLSGPVLAEMMLEVGAEIVHREIIADEIEEIKSALIYLCDHKNVDLILTTGGTGFAKRDITPEATLAVIEKESPGLTEKMRADTISITPKAALSRARAGIRKNTLIINFPGSPKAVRECLQSIIDIIPHGVEILTGEFTEHRH
ncbi:molybdopterin adenylyltransferase [Halanaerobium sp. Z-7514]|uniref:Molybdopterin adenylyltransferase n=1 Tax=Halanaerobium polyolivorans TaxID=2886943 RepID=A0AAW4WUL0_9FIRM|nr:molybdopterin adenylyltransferase [Halanaerobium polyolivorans]MCC3144200.1 molybdopterin adenylyltransferase [Halanaerobium polyolivorans]